MLPSGICMQGKLLIFGRKNILSKSFVSTEGKENGYRIALRALMLLIWCEKQSMGRGYAHIPFAAVEIKPSMSEANSS